MVALRPAVVRQDGHVRFPVADEVDAGTVRRAVARYATELGADPYARGRAELVAVELATNIARHGRPGGWVLVRPVAPASIEVIAVDRGPSIVDVAAVLEGRISRPGGLGRGLAAVRRASVYFDVYSAPDRGTTVLSVVDLAGGDPPRRAPRAWGGVSVAVADVCGDGWAVVELDDGLAVAVVDGLGHGPRASVAADAALAAFAADPADLSGLVARANEAMRATRGGALTACHLVPARQRLDYVAVGNVSGRVMSGSTASGLVFANGTLGPRAEPPHAKVRSAEWPPDATLVLWTDGLTSRLSLPADLLAHDPALVAATAHRDHSRERDDATLVVVRNTSS
jgi:anti-sigma regulatory factor (Ser/Thr protein kinase)